LRVEGCRVGGITRFRVKGLGFRSQGLGYLKALEHGVAGFWVWGLGIGIRAWRRGFRIYGLEFRV
jgi:hypothetical protein